MSAAKIAYALLTAHAPLVALVGDRVYPLVAPEGAQLPAVIYAVQSEREARTLANPAKQSHALTFAQVRITAVVAPNDYGTLTNIMAAIRGALNVATPAMIAGASSVVVHSGSEGPDQFDQESQLATRTRTVQLTFSRPA